MKRPDFALEQAISWYIADYGAEVEASTMRRYAGNLRSFIAWLPAPRVLANVTHEHVDRWSRQTTTNEHTRMNRIIALKSFATYLAKHRLWFDGSTSHPISVLSGLEQPQPSPKGTPGYRDDEVRQIVHAIPDTETSLRTHAIIAVELHGFRAKEVRTMLLRNVVLPVHGEVQGHFVIDERKRTKSFDGVRVVPMEPYAKDAILRYTRIGRPDFIGTDDEPLFLTQRGGAFTESGWDDMAERMKRELRPFKIRFRQHRFRATRVQMLHAAGVPDSVIIELMGWSKESGPRMLHRYVGQIPLSTLKRATPPLLERLLGRDVKPRGTEVNRTA